MSWGGDGLSLRQSRIPEPLVETSSYKQLLSIPPIINSSLVGLESMPQTIAVLCLPSTFHSILTKV